MKKKWWSVTATYKALHLEKPRRRNLWERTTFLIRAVGEAEAQVVAQEVAKSKEHEYPVKPGDTVRWTLGQVEDVKELIDQKVQQGMEVNWRFFYRTDKQASQQGVAPDANAADVRFPKATSSRR